MNAAATVAADNNSSATAGQQQTGIILWNTTLRQQLYSIATEHVFIWYGADTKSGRENSWFAVCKKQNRRLSLRVLF